MGVEARAEELDLTVTAVAGLVLAEELAGVTLRVVEVGPEATLAAGVPLVFGESDPMVDDREVRISMS